MKFAQLTLKDDIQLSNGSGKRVIWICDCGRETTVEYRAVIRGNTKSCGHCDDISAEEMSTRKFGKLRIEFPEEVSPGSARKIWALCDCGNRTFTRINCLFTGNTKSCGHCNDIRAEEMATRKFGSLRMKEPITISPGSNKKTFWLCDCGKELDAKIVWVVSGSTKSCGHCDDVAAEELALMRFGNLQVKTPETISRSSHQRIIVTCDCGGEAHFPVCGLFNGNHIDCGRCLDGQDFKIPPKVREPKPERLPKPRPDISAPNIVLLDRTPESTLNHALETTIYPPVHGQREIYEFILSLGMQADLEFVTNGLEYNIYVPSKDLLIEYSGLQSHANARYQDIQKYKSAIANGFDYIMIFEDEWVFGRHKVERLLRNRLILHKPISVRPQKCVVAPIDPVEADAFYEAHHYIGRCNAKIHYGVKFGDELVGACSFSHPTRQSSHPWELTRMTSHPGYRVHGIWSKVMQTFIQSHNPTSIVSFSDNRLFRGGVYEKIGFKHDGNINSDYYWCKGNKRFHKSGLRKQAHEMASGWTESQLRTAQGYFRVWDLGKKRWVYRPEALVVQKAE